MDFRDVEKRFVMDAAVKKRLQELGDNEAASHDVEHHFIAASNETAEHFIRLGKRLGFESSAVTNSTDKQGGTWFVFDLISRRDTQMPDLLRESLLMLLLADVHSMIYDGWGTLVAE